MIAVDCKKVGDVMATAKKLPNGQYRVRVYDKKSKTTKSFTALSKMESEVAAARWLKGLQSTAKKGW